MHILSDNLLGNNIFLKCSFICIDLNNLCGVDSELKNNYNNPTNKNCKWLCHKKSTIQKNPHALGNTICKIQIRNFLKIEHIHQNLCSKIPEGLNCRNSTNSCMNYFIPNVLLPWSYKVGNSIPITYNFGDNTNTESNNNTKGLTLSNRCSFVRKL